ncbi:hypothetical protein D3C87_1336420 [compost metagenome]
MAVFGVCQQQAGKKRAEGHGNARQIHQPGGSHHHQQCSGSGHFRQAAFGDHAEHRAQQVATADHHNGNADQYAQTLIHVVDGRGVLIAASQQRHHGNQRDRGDVLKQQNRKGQASMGAGQLLAFGQALQTERGGRQCQSQAQHDGAVQWLPEHKQRQYAQQGAGQQHLCQADAEHRLAHHPQPSGRQLQANDEQQQHHAQFRNVGDAFRIGHKPQHGRANDHPGKQVTQHRAQLQALGQGNGEHGREQKYDCGLQQTAFMGHG